MAKVSDQYGIMILNIVYGNNYFEPTHKCNLMLLTSQPFPNMMHILK
jgi:hypothetical protein